MELTDNAMWYTRSMVVRGIQAMEQSNEEAREWLGGFEGAAAAQTIQHSVKGMIAYQEQLLREAKQYIPDELLPN